VENGYFTHYASPLTPHGFSGAHLNRKEQAREGAQEKKKKGSGVPLPFELCVDSP
jgi:hypothetical protein